MAGDHHQNATGLRMSHPRRSDWIIGYLPLRAEYRSHFVIILLALTSPTSQAHEATNKLSPHSDSPGHSQPAKKIIAQRTAVDTRMVKRLMQLGSNSISIDHPTFPEYQSFDGPHILCTLAVSATHYLCPGDCVLDDSEPHTL